jgi:UDP-N-acetylglucosamine 2-epimerase (non-hydrolysing)
VEAIMSKRFAVVAGARPNFMKVAPILRAFAARGVAPLLVHTGQHYDAKMSGSFFEVLGLPDADVNFNVGSGTHARQTAAVMIAFEEWAETQELDAVVVVGDVNSTMACTIAAAKIGLPVAHVEAGLRAFDRTMPEEVNRIVTDSLSTWLFATSADACANLTAEGAEPGRIHLVGNVMADSLFASLDRARARRPAEALQLPDRFGLITLHRPALVDDPDRLALVVQTIADLDPDVPFVFPVHPRTQANLRDALVGTHTIRLTDPVDYLDFIALEESATVVITDSGGVQEETSLVGTPCVTVRENTERPITLTHGTNTLVGFDMERLRSATSAALSSPRPAVPAIPLWDGHAAERIVDVLLADPPVVRFVPPGLAGIAGNELSTMFHAT